MDISNLEIKDEFAVPAAAPENEPERQQYFMKKARGQLAAFEKQLAAKIEECAREEGQRRVDLSHLSWKNICKEILKSS